MQVSLAVADHERDIVGPEAADLRRVTGLVVSLDALAADPTESAFETGGVAEVRRTWRGEGAAGHSPRASPSAR